MKNLIDLTTLEGTDTRTKVLSLCEKAIRHKVAAVCVYPTFAKLVRDRLYRTNIRTVCVAGAFPSGQSPIHVKISEVLYAINEGAEEIDMVLSRGTFFEGNYDAVGSEIQVIKVACGETPLKVILETGELQTPENIRLASKIAIASGADFIKTSTGKIPISATPEAAIVMLQAIREHYEKTGKKVGFKVSGGISKPKDAEVYIQLVREMLGEQWITPKLFRIGTSRLIDAL